MAHRIGIISDLHADVHALANALHWMDDAGCDEIVCVGDVVDYGLFPGETIALLAQRRIRTVRGNHDRWAPEDDGNGGGWELSKASRKFLASLPPTHTLEREGVRVAVHHASPRGDMDGIDPKEITFELACAHLAVAKTDVLLVGHTHVAFALDVEGEGIIANPAALLCDPADGADNPPATGTFGVLELPSRRFSVYRAKDGTEVDIIRRRLTG